MVIPEIWYTGQLEKDQGTFQESRHMRDKTVLKVI
jgi:hypothetical protein